MESILRITLDLAADLLRGFGAFLAPRAAIVAETPFLPLQLALYKERGLNTRRIGAPTRIALVFLSRCFNWLNALMAIQPRTLVRWHRAAFHALWRWKAEPGRPPIPIELRRLTRAMARENASWGEERIASELRVKLSIRLSALTARKYMPKRPAGQPRCDQR